MLTNKTSFSLFQSPSRITSYLPKTRRRGISLVSSNNYNQSIEKSIIYKHNFNHQSNPSPKPLKQKNNNDQQLSELCQLNLAKRQQINRIKMEIQKISKIQQSLKKENQERKGKIYVERQLKKNKDMKDKYQYHSQNSVIQELQQKLKQLRNKRKFNYRQF